MNLKAFQEEIKKIVFLRDPEAKSSALWTNKIPERLDVYKNNTRSNWTDTLDHDFPLTRQQFTDEEWKILRERYFIKHPPQHWELNASMAPFVQFIKSERNVGAHRCAPYVKELADYEWHDLKVFIDRTVVTKGAGVTNPTVFIRPYQHQLFYWVEAEADPAKPPLQKPEVLVFFRDSKNTRHIQEADPLMILLLDHYKKPNAHLEILEAVRQKILPMNKIPLQNVLNTLKSQELIL